MLWQDIHRYIHWYIPHPPIYPPISSDTSSDTSSNTATTHPLTYDMHSFLQSTTSETPSETSSDASSDTATAHPPTYDVHSFPHPPAHLLAHRHNLQHWHGTTSGIAPCNTMHPSPLPHAGIMPLMRYLPLCDYAWCGLLESHTMLDAAYFLHGQSFPIYMTYLSFPTFIPTSMQWRYSNLLLPYNVVAYTPISMQRRYFDPVWLVHLSEAAQPGSLSLDWFTVTTITLRVIWLFLFSSTFFGLKYWHYALFIHGDSLYAWLRWLMIHLLPYYLNQWAGLSSTWWHPLWFTSSIWIQLSVHSHQHHSSSTLHLAPLLTCIHSPLMLITNPCLSIIHTAWSTLNISCTCPITSSQSNTYIQTSHLCGKYHDTASFTTNLFFTTPLSHSSPLAFHQSPFIIHTQSPLHTSLSVTPPLHTTPRPYYFTHPLPLSTLHQPFHTPTHS